MVRVLVADGDADKYEMRLPWKPHLRYAIAVSSLERKFAMYPRQIIDRHFQKAYYALMESK